ncbi:lipid-A-disaccharide synthase [Marinobacterium sediminicola]|uniref:Lipid-A-disaccharide synthase n=1 Tax=Marinobacterium sediminicola TaxID=518898 RepID=A0ABY1S055_9GAMM|nr:lipid-A-disaccharide synthase [Marinobacterium sediminicola]ULG69695.1 lipid-A-disaccharide synthase [Marinobacterium sediminicola]SMR74577.1 lipid-A-disaccharide synthase [Marinobacterium sediminicola]
MKPLRIGIVAGEASGDILGAGLIQALKQRYPQAEFEGIAGELMLAEGCHSLYPLERLSVMGLVEVLGRLPELLLVRRRLIQHFIDNPPDVFIGVDAPDFTLGMEKALKQAGIPTVHYVSPSVWAWKRKRIFKIKQSTDLMLTLFPFEAEVYQPTQQNLRFVGHPLADVIPAQMDLNAARLEFRKESGGDMVALLPGSRGSEIKYLASPFLTTARWLQQRRPELQFVLPAANQRRYDQLQKLIDAEFSDLNLRLVLQQSREVMAAADAILIASGTATLEACLLQKPMVVAYRMAELTYRIYSRMIKSRWISLPNVLADEEMVPEVLQQQVTPEVMGPLVLKALEDDSYRKRLHRVFGIIGEQLRQNASERAAEAVVELLENPSAER